MLRVILITALALMGSASAFAECVTAKQIIEANPTATVAAHLDGKNSGAFLASAMATTGTELSEKEVLVLTREGYPSIVILFQDGCATRRGKFHPMLVEQWLHGLAG